MTSRRRAVRTTVWILSGLGFLGGCGGKPASSPASGSQAEVRSALTSDLTQAEPERLSAMGFSKNRFGIARTIRASGGPLVDPDNPFFQSLGTNGRSCSTCHVAEAGMSMTPAIIQRRFWLTGGTDPIFRTVDGSNSPLADVSTFQKRLQAYSSLLTRGVIRVGLPIPAGAEFELVDAQDPYGFASAAELSLFRRPLASTNLKLLSTVMWDGRETFKDATQTTGFATIHFDLSHQSNAATLGHAQGATALTDAQREAIIAFETDLFSAQVMDRRAGWLDAHGATGGPEAIVEQPFYFGINDALGADPTGAPFNPVAMTLFDAWARPSDGDDEDRERARDRARAREAIARGETLFNTKPIAIVDVAGLNDDLGLANIPGTCTTCHDTPNAGDHSVPAPLRIGTDNPTPVDGLDASGLPVYTLRNIATGALSRTTDPGRALITGKWKDVGRFKGPTLRAVGGRAPYFHNGSAPDLEHVVQFYENRFQIGLTPREKSDLVAFLSAL